MLLFVFFISQYLCNGGQWKSVLAHHSLQYGSRNRVCCWRFCGNPRTLLSGNRLYRKWPGLEYTSLMNLPLLLLWQNCQLGVIQQLVCFFSQTLKPWCPTDMSWVHFLKDSLRECFSKVRWLDTLLANALLSRLNYDWNVPCSWPKEPLPNIVSLHPGV